MTENENKPLTTNEEVVAEIAKQGLLRNIINHITNNGATVRDPSTLKDLEQDIFLSLMTDKTIVEAFNENHTNYYLSRIVMNNIASSTSKYYRLYRKPYLLSEPLDGDLLRKISNLEDK